MPFYDSSDDLSNFVTSFLQEPREAFGVFAQGYTGAANRLAGLLLDAGHFSDYEVYPVVFLYRHALELSLKHIIYRCADLALYHYRDDISNALQNTHDLRKLGMTANGVLLALFPEDELIKSLIPRIAVTCSDMSEIDPDSFGYRYPTDRKGRPSTKEHQTVNLRAFCSHLSELLEELDTIHFALGA